MGETPDFTKVFIVGILLFIGFYFLFGNFQFFGGGHGYRFVPSKRLNETVEPEITAPKGDFVGTKEVEDFRHIKLNTKPFKVSYITAKKSFIKLENLTVKNGLLEIKAYRKIFSLTDSDLKKLSSATLSGEIEDTNFYGKLIIGLNGKEIFSKILMPGETFEVPVNRSLFQERNEFLVTAESSGWKLWAPTVYIMKNLELKSDFMGEVSQSFDFFVKEEEMPVTLGRLVLKFDEISGNGNLMVSVNGNLVFNDTPSQIQWIDFNGSLIEEGKNTIEMVSEKDTEFTVRNAEVIIFWKREAKENLEMTFSLSSSQYRRLPGEIKFKIEKVFGTPTSLVATIENPDGETHSLVVQGILEEGKVVSATLPKEYAGTGKNKITFSVTGSGGYTITDFRVEL